MFFQALDEKGLAIQSMRSATYLQAGEHLVCQGCHEPKYRTPLMPKSTPLALRREPSKLKPDVDGSNPFSYPRLVQPVLDRHCVKCHAEHPDKPIIFGGLSSSYYHKDLIKYPQVDYVLRGDSVEEPLHRLLAKIKEKSGHVHHAGGLVHNDHPTGSHDRPYLGDGFIVRWGIQEMTGDATSRRSA
jgi:hypothetical protein